VHTETDGEPVIVHGLERAIPARGVDADRTHFDTVLARVADDLGWRVEAHGLRVQKGGAEYVGVMALHPR
jgi:hypothetical protein